MSSPEDIASLSQEELLGLVVQLQRKVQELEASVHELQTEVEWLTREKRRQAARFSKGTRVSNPKRPGRHLARAPSPSARHHVLKQSLNHQ